MNEVLPSPGDRHRREARDAIRPVRLTATARWMARVSAGWDARLETIKRLAESSTVPIATR